MSWREFKIGFLWWEGSLEAPGREYVEQHKEPRGMLCIIKPLIPLVTSESLLRFQIAVFVASSFINFVHNLKPTWEPAAVPHSWAFLWVWCLATCLSLSVILSPALKLSPYSLLFHMCHRHRPLSPRRENVFILFLKLCQRFNMSLIFEIMCKIGLETNRKSNKCMYNRILLQAKRYLKTGSRGEYLSPRELRMGSGECFIM